MSQPPRIRQGTMFEAEQEMLDLGNLDQIARYASAANAIRDDWRTALRGMITDAATEDSPLADEVFEAWSALEQATGVGTPDEAVVFAALLGAAHARMMAARQLSPAWKLDTTLREAGAAGGRKGRIASDADRIAAVQNYLRRRPDASNAEAIRWVAANANLGRVDAIRSAWKKRKPLA